MAISWNVVRSKAAIADIEEIWHYLYPLDPVRADRFLDQVESALSKLEDFPERNALRDLFALDLRGVLIAPWIALYRVDHATNSVEIVRVIDGRRDTTGILI